MRMTRNFFISTNLDDLEHFEQDLERSGFVKPQIHLLTEYEGDAQRHHVHQVSSFMKTDIVHSTLVGAAFGAWLAVLVLLVTLIAGWYATWVGAIPFVYLAIVLLGFSTFIGAFWGIQNSNSRTRQFDQVVRAGKHVFFVDHPQKQNQLLDDVSKRYPSMQAAGRANGASSWIVYSQQGIKHFFTHTFP